MSKINDLYLFIEKSNDIILTGQIVEAGFHRGVLSKLVHDGLLIKYGRGVYMKPSAWDDEMFLLQHRYTKGIFSHETALYLHGFSDRTPARYTMTFPWGYHAASLESENVNVKRAVKDKYELGIMQHPSPAGNTIMLYDLERTLCDIVRGNYASDIQVVNAAMKRYAASKIKDIQKLMNYAEQLRVKPKMLNYMEILL